MDGDPGETLVLRGDPLALLETSPIFRGLDRDTLAAIAAELEWLSLPGGATLFDAGEAPDAMYLVIAGCLGAYAQADPARLLGRIPAGETVGEMGLVSGHPRSATVRALRDSELARLPRESFDRVIVSHPAAMLRVAQLVVERLEARDRRAGSGSRTYTLLPQSIEVDVGGFAAELVAALGRLGRAELVWSVRGADHTSAWFHRIESANDFVVYVADPEPTPWSKLCVRQADAVLFVARADAEARPWPLRGAELGPGSSARAELVLLHDGALQPGAAARWRSLLPGAPHHHVRDEADVARVARLLTGRGVGLVLSGGGARGFAHIGVVRALRESGVAIDLVGGTSMGAIMGAGVAAGWTTEEMVERFHRTFVATNPLSDYTLPIVSLVAGRKVSRLLRQEFGEIAIEDLPLPFYAVSANLTTGHGSVHRDGELWRWLRASVAIPGVLPPVFHRGEVHVDGGAINNMPVDVMRAQHPGVVIGVDVGSDATFTSDIQDVDLPPLWKLLGWFRRHRQRPTILQILWRAGMVNSDAATIAGRRLTDLLLQPPLADVDLLNWRAFPRAIEAGYRHARAQLATLDAEARVRLGLGGR
ncbi:MAG: patatin-like phospholipase family protein [Proteobacteria bacterium]|nr:patatin-like phospholipase family protein [Pseudomonadota bacterium]